MKTKGISVWEQYVEYIVLVIALIIFGYFAWTTFTNKATVVKGGKTITTENVDEELILSSDILAPKLHDSAPSPIEMSAPKELLATFEEGIVASLSPSDRVVFPRVDLTSTFAVNQDLVSELRTYMQPTVPAPEQIRTHQWFATVDETEIHNVPELGSLFEGAPHDATWVQVAAEFDMDQVLEEFQQLHGEVAAIPEQWYDGVVDVFDLRLERETLLESGWSESELIKVMPGRITFREELGDDSIDTVERDSIVDHLRGGSQGQIIRPPFYAVKGFSPDQATDPASWAPTERDETELDLSEPEQGPVATLRKKIEDVSAKYSRIEQKVSELEAAIAAAQRSGGGSSDGGPMGTDGSPNSGNSDLIKDLTKQLMLAMNERTELAAALEQLLSELRSIDSSVADELEESFGGKIWIWAHDLSVQPGRVYRYRISLEIANPFFGRKPSLYPEQQELADPVAIRSIPSAWSDPIEAQPPLQWFVLRAIPTGASVTTNTLDAGRVSAEVYHFTDGLWHKNTIQVAAGQRLASPDGGDFQTQWFVLDMVPWLDASEKNLRNHRASWVVLQHMRTGVTEIVSPWEQATSARLQDLRLQEQSSQYFDDSNLM
ncbi:MAG: hypothetical protein QGI78_05545 [Phycisphaerales bacterium]|nr:hypothetical protein [Phycisphaerales bacterium]